MDPLLQFGDEGTVKARGNPTIKQQFGRELGRHRPGTVSTARLGQQIATNAERELTLHHPERESNAVPAEIPKASVGLEAAMRTDIVGEKGRSSPEAERHRHPFYLANAPVVFERAPN